MRQLARISRECQRMSAEDGTPPAAREPSNASRPCSGEDRISLPPGQTRTKEFHLPVGEKIQPIQNVQPPRLDLDAPIGTMIVLAYLQGKILYRRFSLPQVSIRCLVCQGPCRGLFFPSDCDDAIHNSLIDGTTKVKPPHVSKWRTQPLMRCCAGLPCCSHCLRQRASS